MSDNQIKVSDSKVSEYLESLVKLIPAEIVALYAVLAAFVPETLTGQLFVTIPLFALTPFYLYFSMGVNKIGQIAISTFAFVVWLFAIGGPFVYFGWYEAWMGGTLLALYTLVPPMVYGKRLPAYEGENKEMYKGRFTTESKSRQMSWREI